MFKRMRGSITVANCASSSLNRRGKCFCRRRSGKWWRILTIGKCIKTIRNRTAGTAPRPSVFTIRRWLIWMQRPAMGSLWGGLLSWREDVRKRMPRAARNLRVSKICQEITWTIRALSTKAAPRIHHPWTPPTTKTSNPGIPRPAAEPSPIRRPPPPESTPMSWPVSSTMIFEIKRARQYL